MVQTHRSRRFQAGIVAVALLLVGAAMPTHASDGAGSWGWATGPSIYDEEGKRNWGVEIIPYLWLASLEGRLALPAGGDIPIDSSFSSLAANLDAGLAGVIDLRYR